MSIETALRNRIEDLISQSGALTQTNQYRQARSTQQVQQCAGWMTAAVHAIETASGGSRNSYLSAAEKIVAKEHGFGVPDAVGALAEILRRLLADVDAGLLGSVADHARAETFDNFLDHGQAYLDKRKTQEAGVIVGVVFEDSVRRICRKHAIAENKVQLEDLISALTKEDILTGIKAKRARAAAAVRTSATHARWEEFTDSDVAAAAEFTRELISDQLDG